MNYKIPKFPTLKGSPILELKYSFFLVLLQKTLMIIKKYQKNQAKTKLQQQIHTSSQGKNESMSC